MTDKIELKTGDKVYVHPRFHTGGRGGGRIGTIERITPTGRFIVNGITYRAPTLDRKGGWTASATGENTSTVANLTDERIENVKRGQAYARIEQMRYRYSTDGDLTLDQLKRIETLWQELVSIKAEK